MEQGAIPGVGFAIFNKEGIVLESGLGVLHRKKQQMVTSNTPFTLASCSKIVTWTALMKLHEQGAFELDDIINDKLSFDITHPDHGEIDITYYQLFTHTSSIVDNWDIMCDYYVYDVDSPITQAQFLEDYLSVNGKEYSEDNFLEEGPGEVFEYSNIATALGGLLVEIISGMPFDEYCNQNIFQPIGMNNTSWRLTTPNRPQQLFTTGDFKTDDIATPFKYHEKRDTFSTKGHYASPDYSNGGLRSSAHDLCLFLRCFLTDGLMPSGQRLISKETIELMTSGKEDVEDGEQIALGWFVSDTPIGKVIGHDGSEEGVATSVQLHTELGMGCVVLINTDAEDYVEDILTLLMSNYSPILNSKKGSSLHSLLQQHQPKKKNKNKKKNKKNTKKKSKKKSKK